MPVHEIGHESADRAVTVAPARRGQANASMRRRRDERIEAFGRADADDEVRAPIASGAGRAIFPVGAFPAAAERITARKEKRALAFRTRPSRNMPGVHPRSRKRLFE